MRIALYGASGTGKTTLARAMADLLGVELNPVGSRQVALAMGFDSPYDVDAAGRRAEFQRRLLVEKVAWERVESSFVTDRTTCDNLAYTAMHDVSALDDEMLRLTREGMARYDLVVFCPIQAFQNLGDDPARVSEGAYHRVYEALVSGLVRAERDALGSAAPRHATCPASTPEARRVWARYMLETELVR